MLLGIIGYPIKHSISPRVHETLMKTYGIEGRYLAFEVKPNDLRDAILGAKALGFTGLNVTIPYKEEVLKFVNPVGDAKLAVNTIDLRTMKGYNTDIYGVEMAFRSAEIDVSGKVALIVGAGGAAKAVAIALLKMGAKVVITNRTQIRGIETASALREYGSCVFHPMERIGEVKAEILVNATPVGMKGSPGMPVDEELLKEDLIVFDVVYNPVETQLIRKAKEKGCKAITGLEMFVYQAEKAFEIWTGIKPDVELIRRASLEALNVQN
ncbi:MAG: shikimate dehydrogenase [Archaeoglobaceae archaeon]